MDHRELARLGGEATKKKYGSEFYSRIAKLGSAKAGRPPKPDDELKPESLRRRLRRAQGKS